MGFAASINAAISRFVNPKRFVMLSFFALLAGYSTTAMVQILATNQVRGSARLQHAKVFLAYERAVERHRKLLGTAQEGMQIQNMVSALNSERAVAPRTPEASPWWLGLHDVRKEFSSLRIGILVRNAQSSPDALHLLERVQNKPRGYSASDEEKGWNRSFFLLPTRNAAAFTVSSYVKDEVGFWKEGALKVGLCVVMLFLAFGWFWTRAQGDIVMNKTDIVARVGAMRMVADEMGLCLKEIQAAMAELKTDREQSGGALSRGIAECVDHIHLLAVNGSLESLRTAETQRMFHGLLQEINQQSLKCKRLAAKLESHEQDALVRLEASANRFNDVLKRAG